MTNLATVVTLNADVQEFTVFAISSLSIYFLQLAVIILHGDILGHSEHIIGFNNNGDSSDL